MSMDIKELEKALETHKGNIEARVKELQETADAKTSAELKATQESLAALTVELTAIKEQVKVANQREIPGLGGQEAKKFDFGCAVKGIMLSHLKQKDRFTGDPWKEAGVEKEIIMTAMNKRSEAMVNKETMIGGDGTLGGYLIPEEVTSEIIDLVIADMPIMELGPNVIRGLVGDLPISKVTGRTTGYWLGETEKPTASTVGFGQVFMRPKKAGAFTVQSNRLIYQSRGVSDQIVRQELANSLKLVLEEGYIKGLGTEKQPKGITNQAINSMTAVGTNGARFRLDNASSMIQYLDVLNEYKDGGENFGWLMRPEVRGGMKRERVIQYSGQSESSGQPILPMNLLMSNKVLEDQLGHKIRTTTLLSATETQGSSSTCSTVVFGNWKKFRIGMWRDFVLRASDVAGDGSTGSALLDDTMYIVCFQETDCMVDRDAAFCKMAGAQTVEASW